MIKLHNLYKGVLQSKVDFKKMRVHFRRTVWGMCFKKLGCFPLKYSLSDLSQLIFTARSWGQKLNAGLFLHQVDLIFTVSHPVCCLSSHRLNVGNWQVSNIDGQNAGGFRNLELAQNIQILHVCKISQENRLFCEMSTASYFHVRF